MRRPREALVVGGGLAGAPVAAALAGRGWRVTLLATSGGASSIPAAVMAPPPLPGNDPVTALRRRGAAVTRAWLQRLAAHDRDCGVLGRGVLLLARRERQRARWSRLPLRGPGPVRVPREAVAELAGVALPVDAVFDPGGVWLRPAALCAALLARHRIEVLAPAAVQRLEHRNHRWIARDASGATLATAPTAVVAAGMDSARLLPGRASLIPVRGQATAVVADGPVGALRHALSGGGYVAPAADGRVWLGATLDRHCRASRPSRADDDRNLRLHAELWPGAAPPRVIEHFAAVRATTRDRLPLVGAIDTGLWITAGHGTQGLLSAPLAGLLLAAAIDGGRLHPVARQLDPRRRSAHVRVPAAVD